ncbi:MAG: glycosyltransferase family 39 protein [Alphaproteobacteria bacterium]|uniref:Glycosyltransferase family 39 protein n=1 Tax=Candidatus Nitrobium versatile TaxID=2884831 RepID=A0A953M3X2_9BACT|nr:glycosyltransferase family 39 protein [Candidatus Nitrobium versatile]
MKRVPAILVRWAFVSALLLVMLSAPAFAADNVLENGSFEEVRAGNPALWSTDVWDGEQGATLFRTEKGMAASGNFFITIEARKPNDAKFLQKVRVKPDTLYKLSCWIQARNISPNTKGANITVLGILDTSADLYDTGGRWEYAELYGRTGPGQRELIVTARLGGYGNLAAGVASFDNIRLEEVKSAPAGVKIVNFFADEQPGAKDSSFSSSLIWFALLSIAAIAAVFYFFRTYFTSPSPFPSPSGGEGKGEGQNPLWLYGVLVCSALAVRFLLAASIAGYPPDIVTFKAWAVHAAGQGLFRLYSAGIFIDYPPGYLYVLYGIGKIRELLSLDFNSGAFLILVKSPAIIADLLSSLILFSTARSRWGDRAALGISLAYLLNPAVILNSAVWGQIDSVLALLLVISLSFIVRKQLQWAVVAFVGAVLVKPQALIVAPLLLVALVREGNIKILTRAALYGLAAFVLIVLPFSLYQGPLWIIELYRKTITSYPYASLNAFNLFALLGGNWVPESTQVFLLSYSTWGSIFVVCIAAASVYFSLRSKDPGSVYGVGMFLFAAVFLFASRMHERYLFPLLLLALMSFIHDRKRSSLYLFAGFSITHFINVGYALALALKNTYQIPRNDPFLIVISLANLFLFGYLVRSFFSASPADEAEGSSAAFREEAAYRSSPAPGNTVLSWKETALTRKDLTLLGGITLVCAVVSLYNVGTRQVPETFWKPERVGESLSVDFGEKKPVKRIYYYAGLGEGQYRIDYADGSGQWKYGGTIQQKEIFQWKYKELDMEAESVRITVEKPGAMLQEMAFVGRDLERPPLRSFSPSDAPSRPSPSFRNLFDEQDTIEIRPSFRSGMFFDEIYFARTAYEYLNRLEPYENTHPPLGKVLISWGIALFGMNPFGWRIMGVVAGVAMVPLMYLFGKRLFGKTEYAGIAAFLTTFEFMRFAQSRIATVDVFAVLFIILMYYFMYRFSSMRFSEAGFRATLVPLGLSGLFFGMGVACKWIGLYAGLGLAVLFFYSLYDRYREYKDALRRYHAKTSRKDAAEREKASAVISGYPGYIKKTILWSVLFFVIVPVGIYGVSYIPFMVVPGPGHSLSDVVASQSHMYNYHKNLKQAVPHPFSSKWWEWPLIKRPMWFYMGLNLPPGKISSIVSMGNPAVWWGGILCMAFLFVRTLQRKVDWKIMFIVIGFAAQYVPWMLVPRETYIYHFFASTPFLILGTVAVIMHIKERSRRGPWLLYSYLGLVLLLFVMFYPILSGFEIDKAYAARFLRWFNSWIFFV